MTTRHAPVRLAMVGGGLDAFIGAVHRKAASLDGMFDLVAGCLSTDPEVCRASGEAYRIAPDRSYTSLDALIAGERTRPKHERAEVVSIVTPNHTHHAIAKACLTNGFHTLVEKPMTTTSAEAEELRDVADANDRVCAVMYNYSGYPMVRQAREMIASGAIGAVRKVFVEYHQGWLSTKAEDAGVAQAEWRTDPALAGLGGALGDIGTHAEHLARFVTGLEIASLSAELTSFVPGRALDDDAAVLLRFLSGAKGVLTASQVCAGEGNGLTLRVYGDAGALRWRQESPEHLEHLTLDGATRTITRGGPGTTDFTHALSRIPVGHPEGFIEAFANIYRGLADRVRGEGSDLAHLLPTATSGHTGVRFVEKCVESSKNDGAWTDW
ncbi:MAG: Gfo/Idh/MocA family oxidoreductase [Planctomycetota bacterium]